jgi:hypothetical protein
MAFSAFKNNGRSLSWGLSLLLVVALQSAAVAQTITLGSVNPTSVCPGSPVTVEFSSSYTINGNGNGSNTRSFSVEIATTSTFTNPVSLTTVTLPINTTQSIVAPINVTQAGGSYYVRVKQGSTSSASLTGLVIYNPTSITTQPAASSVICPGSPATVSVAATGTNVSYQWFLSGSSSPVGTGPTFTTSTLGTYYAVVSGTCGNVTSTNFTLTGDVTAPSLNVPSGQDVNLSADCSVSIPNLVAGSSATDNCSGPVTITQSPAAGTTQSLAHNGTLTVTLTATDAANNATQRTVILTAKDVTPPVKPTLADVVGECTATAVAPTTTDNCSGTITGTTTDALTSSTQGTRTITWTFTDAAGNITTATQQVIVRDNTAPGLSPKNVTVFLNAQGSATITESSVVASKSDNCGTVNVSLSKSSFDCSNTGTNTVTINFNDGNGNSSTTTATVTVVDNSAPTAVAKNISVMLGIGGSVTVQPGDVNNGSTDNCTIASYSLSQGTFNAAGSYPVILTVKDASGNESTASATITVNKRVTTLTYGGSSTAQYSDPATVQATLIDQTTGAKISGVTVTFVIGTQSVTAVTDAAGVAAGTIVLTQAPTTYQVVSTFTGNGTYTGSNDSDPFAITKEDARVTYTGGLFYSTSSATSSNATVTLSATIQDISAVTPTLDPNAGDIRKATVTFYVKNGTDYTQIGNAPIGLVSSNDTKVGVATLNWTADIGNANSGDFTIRMVVDGWYSRDAAEDNTVVTISKPLDDFITGGGYIILDNPAGERAGDKGTRSNFGFNVKYNKSGKNLQGNINTLVRRTEPDGILHTYQVKGNVMTSLSVQPTAGTGSVAQFFGKASIQDITNPTATIAVDGNATLQVTMTDKGDPGSSDQIGIAVYNKSGGLWLSTNWNGVKTTEKLLAGGNLVIRGSAVSARLAAPEVVEQPMKLTAEASPNPTSGLLKVSVTGAGQQPTVKLRIYDLTQRVAGEWTLDMENGQGEKTIDIRNTTSGIYLLSVEGDRGRAVKRIVKGN